MPMPSFFTPEQRVEVIAEYRNGVCSTALARKWGCHPQTVLNLLARHGVQARPQEEWRAFRSRQWKPEEIAEIKDLWEGGTARTALARKFSCGIEVISRVLSVELGLDGAARRFRRGPNHPGWRGGRYITAQGYVLVRVPADHRFAAMAGDDGAVPEHRLVMAERLGRALTQWETVHHINGVRSDNRPENLQLRMGRHGNGVALQCRDCGSHDVEAIPLAGALDLDDGWVHVSGTGGAA